jgi:hypothetical protein
VYGLRRLVVAQANKGRAGVCRRPSRPGQVPQRLRDALTTRIQSVFRAAELNGQAINEQDAKQLINQGQALLDHASACGSNPENCAPQRRVLYDACSTGCASGPRSHCGIDGELPCRPGPSR